MTYRAPVADIMSALRFGSGRPPALADCGALAVDDAEAIIREAGRFAEEKIAPLNRTGDKEGARFRDGEVTMPAGWRETYRAWREAGWNGVAAPESAGGQALPQAINAACIEIWNSAALAFGLGPLLTMSAVDALEAHGSAALKQAYLRKLVSGEWMGTMQLTESQAGSDVGMLRTRAARADDGSYRLTGQKIFITYGEHDLTENIVHFVLARLSDAPAGNRGISLFLVPKILPDGTRNDVFARSVEHKLGLHASPTCTMAYGDGGGGGATGFLIGRENDGLACMFTMMNRARLAVGLQGVAVAERATQQAVAFAKERRQGRAGSETQAPIIVHPDVKRMLLTMRALTRAARNLCYATAGALDRAAAGDTAAREQAALLTPVAKAFSTDIANEVASLGVQVHGGMGYVEETGAAQHVRDARILAIYEGTNGIQALDLVTRKLGLADGAVMARHLNALRTTATDVQRRNEPSFGRTGERLGDSVECLARTTDWLASNTGSQAALAGASPILRLFAETTGGCLLADEALAAVQAGDGAERIATARFFAENIAVHAPSRERTVTEGGDAIVAADFAAA